MVSRTHGYRYKSRKILRKRPRERGLKNLSRLLHRYNVGDKVLIYIDPAFITNAPHRRYHGKIGTVIGMQGRSYIVEVYLGEKRKLLVVPPLHVRPFAQGSGEANTGKPTSS